MAKDPAFLFYPGDFNTGTQFFTDEQVGKYIRLLMAQHQHGHLPESHMLHICKTYDKDVFSKFTKDNDGLWFNERLEYEIVKRKKYSESRSKNRLYKKNISSTYDSHMENKNRNENISIVEIGEKSNLFVTIQKKYSSDSLIKIYDLIEWFKRSEQFISLTNSGYSDFAGFMKSKPAAMFTDQNHLYNAFIQHHKKTTGVRVNRGKLQ